MLSSRQLYLQYSSAAVAKREEDVVGVGVWGGWVFSDCAVVTHVHEQHLSMCKVCPCVRTALHTTNLPNGESRTVTTGSSQPSETKKKRLVGANLLSSMLLRERNSIATDSA